MINWLRKRWNKDIEDYDMSCNYKIMITDDVTNTKFSIIDWIKALDERIQFLEDERIWAKSEILRLQQENVELTNELYRLENSLDARIDILAEHYRRVDDV